MGAFRIVVGSEGEKEVERCPRCGVRLDGDTVRPRDLTGKGCGSLRIVPVGPILDGKITATGSSPRGGFAQALP